MITFAPRFFFGLDIVCVARQNCRCCGNRGRGLGSHCLRFFVITQINRFAIAHPFFGDSSTILFAIRLQHNRFTIPQRYGTCPNHLRISTAYFAYSTLGFESLLKSPCSRIYTYVRIFRPVTIAQLSKRLREGRSTGGNGQWARTRWLIARVASTCTR